jgi:hypothetical protein
MESIFNLPLFKMSWVHFANQVAYGVTAVVVLVLASLAFNYYHQCYRHQ